jgi:hypothetical protein
MAGDAQTAGVYTGGMSIFDILVGIAMAIVLIVLFTGIISMVRGGEFNNRWGNRLMRMRVLFQALAIGLLGLAVLFDG